MATLAILSYTLRQRLKQPADIVADVIVFPALHGTILTRLRLRCLVKPGRPIKLLPIKSQCAAHHYIARPLWLLYRLVLCKHYSAALHMDFIVLQVFT